MNKILIYIIGFVLILSSCKSNYSDIYAETEIKTSKDELIFKPKVIGLSFGISGNSWRIDTTETADWCKIVPIYEFNERNYITVKVEPYDGIETRTTKFKLVADFATKEIPVTQLGSAPIVLSNKGDSLSYNKDRTFVDILITTNIDIMMETDSPWLTIVNDYVNDETQIRIALADNTTGAERVGNLVFTQKEGNYEKKIKFVQTNDVLDYVPTDISHLDGNHVLTITSASSSTHAEGKPIEKSFDNNTITHYQSEWQLRTEPVVLEYHFTNESSLNYFIYTPYAGDSRKSFTATEIWTKSEGEEYVKWKDYEFKGDAAQLIVFDEPILNPLSVKFVVNSVAANITEPKYICGACAEMRFFSTDLQFSNIFEDKSYSSLKEGVTLEDIFKMKDEFFRTIAEYLYHNRYPAIRIGNYLPYPTPVDISGVKPLGLFDNVTGIAVKENEEVIVMVDKLGTQVINLFLLDVNSDFKGVDYLLTDGVSKFVMKTDGLLYVKHHSESASASSVAVHIAGGIVNGCYDTQKHTLTEGVEYLNKAKGRYFDMLGKYVHLILPVESLKKNTTSIKELVEKYDRIIELQLDFNGAIKYDRVQKNRICIKSGVERGLVNNAIIIPEDKIDSYTTLNLIKGEVLWDISTLTAEVFLPTLLRRWTPAAKDLYSAYVSQEMDESAMLIDGDLYEQAYSAFQTSNSLFADTKILEDAKRAIPFWQLYLYEIKVLGNEDFYKSIHQEGLKNSSEKQFITNCNTVANIDFNEFFQAWHFVSLGTVKPEKAPLGVKYICDSNVDMFKNPQSVVAGNYRLTKTNSNGVVTNTITIDPSSKITENAIAYEVINFGVVKQVSNKKIFIVDDYLTSMKIFAVGVDGTKVELPKI